MCTTIVGGVGCQGWKYYVGYSEVGCSVMFNGVCGVVMEDLKWCRV